MRRLLAAVLVLSVAACFGRVSAYASSPADQHACCRGEGSAPAKTPVVSECCPVSAAVSFSGAVRVDVLVPTAAPAVLAPSPVFAGVSSPAAPPGPQSFRSSVPARGPPL